MLSGVLHTTFPISYLGSVSITSYTQGPGQGVMGVPGGVSRQFTEYSIGVKFALSMVYRTKSVKDKRKMKMNMEVKNILINKKRIGEDKSQISRMKIEEKEKIDRENKIA